MLPVLEISFYRTLIKVKDGFINYRKKIIFYNMPHVFVITDRKPVPEMITIHTFSIHYLSEQITGSSS